MPSETQVQRIYFGPEDTTYMDIARYILTTEALAGVARRGRADERRIFKVHQFCNEADDNYQPALVLAATLD